MIPSDISYVAPVFQILAVVVGVNVIAKLSRSDDNNVIHSFLQFSFLWIKFDAKGADSGVVFGAM